MSLYDVLTCCRGPWGPVERSETERRLYWPLTEQQVHVCVCVCGRNLLTSYRLISDKRAREIGYISGDCVSEGN